MKKAVLFDLDGTLADTVGDISNAVNAMLEAQGFPRRDRTAILAAISYGRREFIRRCIPSEKQNNDAEIDRCLELYNDYYQAHYMQTTLPYPGIPAVLHTLKQNGIAIAVVTNKAHGNACYMIERLFPANLFSGVWGLADLPPKPNPSIALRAAREIGVNPSDCLFVGDSELDIQTAHNAGMQAIGVSWGYRSETILQNAGADLIAHSADELAHIVLAQSD